MDDGSRGRDGFAHMATDIAETPDSPADSGLLDQLDQIVVTLPCQMNWGAMRGDDRMRYCELCQRHVHDFRAMTRPEIAALFAAEPERVCGRVWRDSEGRLITKETAATAASRTPWRFQFSIGALFILTLICAPIFAVSPSLARWAQDFWADPADESEDWCGGAVVIPANDFDGPRSPSPQ